MSPFQKLWNYLAEKKSEIITATFYSVANKIFDIAPPLLIGMTVDVVVKKKDSFLAKFGFTEAMEQIWVIAVLTVLIWALESIFEYALKIKWRTLAQVVQHDLRYDTYKHVQKLELSYFEDKSTGNLISIINDDVNQLERFLDNGANSLIQVATTVLSIGAIFFYFSPIIAVFAFLPVPLVLWGSYFFQNRIQKRYKTVRGEVGLLNSILANNIAGISTIKSYCAEDYELSRIEKQSQKYSVANQAAIKISSSFSPLIRMVILMGFLCSMVLGGYQTLQGNLEIGSYSILIFLTQRLLWPLTSLGATYDLYQRAMASTDRIFSLLDTPIKIEDGNHKIEQEKFDGVFSLENVSFEYEKGYPVLKDISFSVDKGHTVAIVGATGSGKSTLVKLLLRFYDVNSGAIKIDGKDLRDLSQKELRDLVAFVGQENYLFHGTVKENIAYANPNCSQTDIEDAAKMAEAHEFIMALPNGYDTIVGERGQKLSGGQRQRISIARAILKNAPIFIFDEATSAVDNETEAAIQRSFERVTSDRSTVMIAHRLSTVRHADCIYVLGNGEIIEKGTHEELLALKGSYFNLWNVQTGNH